MKNIDLYLTKYEWKEKPFLDQIVDTLNAPVRWAFGGHTITWLKNPEALAFQEGELFKEESPSTRLRILGGVITAFALPLFLLFQLLVIPTKWRAANQKQLRVLLFARQISKPSNEPRSTRWGLQLPTLDNLPPDVLNHIYSKFLRREEAFPSRFINKRFANLALLKKTGVKAAIRDAFEYVSDRGTHRLVEWYHQYLHYPFTARSMLIAAKRGNLNMMKWLHAKGCPWGNACANAAEGGHLAVLQWARANGCKWDEYTGYMAASRGHLEVLQWVLANGDPLYGYGQYEQKYTCEGAAEGGHLEILQLARNYGCPWNANTCRMAASGGHLEVLQWAHANGCPWDAETCSAAARGGHLEVLQWARANGCPWSEQTCLAAAGGGHLETLQWARANGCPWNAGTCSCAAVGGHLAVLQWARANGCPWDEYTCANAEAKRHFEVWKWARANGCPWNANRDIFFDEQNQEALEWAKANDTRSQSANCRYNWPTAFFIE